MHADRERLALLLHDRDVVADAERAREDDGQPRGDIAQHALHGERHAGAGKADVTARIVADPRSFPAGLVATDAVAAGGDVTWLLDREAAARSELLDQRGRDLARGAGLGMRSGRLDPGRDQEGVRRGSAVA